MLFIMNSIPNSIWGEQNLLVSAVEQEFVDFLLTEGWESAIGHENFAEIVSAKCRMQIPARRVNVAPNWECGDSILAALITTPRRLNEGEKWKEEELLTMPIKWVWVRAA